jgi:Molybdopterin-guanine dinucleotide biosynthesis protein A
MRVIGLVLAGGSGSRLGTVRKWQLRLGGKMLIQRITEQFRNDAQQVLISARPDEEGIAPYGMCLPDLDLPIAGPLAGLVAAMDHIGRKVDDDAVIVSVAVDTPFLPANYVSRLLAAVKKGHAAAQAGWRGNGYPTNAAWRLSALFEMQDRLIDGTEISSPRALLAALDAPLVDWSNEAEDDPFANINTLGDLIALAGRRA